jgi:hypothetical protein
MMEDSVKSFKDESDVYKYINSIPFYPWATERIITHLRNIICLARLFLIQLKKKSRIYKPKIQLVLINRRPNIHSSARKKTLNFR